MNVDIVRRSLPNLPNGYTPTEVECPGTLPSVRPASSLSQNEAAWVAKRRNNTITPMENLLSRLNITNFDSRSYIQTHSKNVSALPNIGIAMSGGGLRAFLNGAGVIEAFDSRTPNSTMSGHLGGLLQSSTYLAGLSGGSWLVGSLFMNNFTTVTALRDDPSNTIWDFSHSVIEGPRQGSIQILDTAQYYSTLVNEVEGKSDAGFETTITDIWGRGLSFQLINASNGGPAYTWSSIALAENFQNGDTPFPVVIADERLSGETLIPSNTTVYEFSPFEMGTWDPTAYGFVPTRYLGTNFSAGFVPTNNRCTIGFDSGGFIMGTSSSVFNEIFTTVNSSSLPSILKKAIDAILNKIGVNNEDIADYSPNPFFHYNNISNPSANSSALVLVDGSEDGQNIPLHPLTQPVRGIDVIFAVDFSADTSYNWPNGSSLVKTYERSSSKMANGTSFPSIPDTNTFINLGLNSRPTFFGCNASNTTSTHPAPLIVYIPNSPYAAYSNTSTFDLTYNDTQRDALIANGYDMATLANGTRDSRWPMCVGCAILSRSFHRTGTTVPVACTKCFQTFCWDGTINSTTPAAYEPSPSLETVTTQSTASALSRQDKVGWVGTPNTRGTLTILLSCLFTILACTWSVLHLNLPDPRDSTTVKLLRKLKWTVVTIVFPEFILAHASGERQAAIEDMALLDGSKNRLPKPEDIGSALLWIVEGRVCWRQRLLYPLQLLGRLSKDSTTDAELGKRGGIVITPTPIEHNPESSDKPIMGACNLTQERKQWTLLHSYYANMGGIRVKVGNDGPSEVSRTYCLTGKKLAQIDFDADYSPLQHLTLTAEEIQDKSNSDGFAKIIAMVQIFWLIFSIILRAARHIPSTQLELLTLAYSILAIFIYAAYFNKPQNIEHPTTIFLPTLSDDKEHDRRLRACLGDTECSSFFAKVIWHSDAFLGESLRQGTRIPNDCYNFNLLAPCLVTLVVVTSIFGGIHCIAWNFAFPTGIELKIWRTASVMTTTLPALIFASQFVATLLRQRGNPANCVRDEGRLHPFHSIMITVGYVAYVLARVAIMTVAFTSLRRMPTDVYLTTWARNLPNIQ